MRAEPSPTHGAAVVGLNCSRGPATMLPLLEEIRAAVDVPDRRPAGALPDDPGDRRRSSRSPRPTVSRLFPIELEPLTSTPASRWREFARRARELGVDYIGICCGGGPAPRAGDGRGARRDAPASRYSPAIELHPVLGAAGERRGARGDGRLAARRPRPGGARPAGPSRVASVCGRYVLAESLPELAAFFDAGISPELAERYRPSYNVPPSNTVPAVAIGRDGERTLGAYAWGLVPSWAKDPAIGARTFNARAEGLATRPAFRGPFRSHRCLVPAAPGFYEWSKHGADRGTPYLFARADGAPMALAGLWSAWRPGQGGESGPVLHDRHDRRRRRRRCRSTTASR